MFLEWTTSSLLNQTLTVCKSPESERSSSSSSSSKRMLPQEDLHLFLPNSRNSSFQDKKLFWDLHWHPFSLPPLAAQPKTTHNHPPPSSPPKNYPQQQLEIPPSVCRYNPIYSSSTCNRREQPASQPQRHTHTHTHTVQICGYNVLLRCLLGIALCWSSSSSSRRLMMMMVMMVMMRTFHSIFWWMNTT